METNATESRLLAGHAAFVTGGARGIGAATCRRLAANGAAVAVGYRRSRDAANNVVAAIAESGGTAVAAPGDISNPKAAAAALHRASSALGRPFDVLVHNAWPGWQGGAFDGIPWSTYQWYIDQMFRPAVELSREALPPMREARWAASCCSVPPPCTSSTRVMLLSRRQGRDAGAGARHGARPRTAWRHRQHGEPRIGLERGWGRRRKASESSTCSAARWHGCPRATMSPGPWCSSPVPWPVRSRASNCR